MATKPSDRSKRRVLKSDRSLRDKISKTEAPKKRRLISKSISSSKGHFSRVYNFLKREYHPIKLPDNVVGRFLTKKRHFIPRFFTDAWTELKQVTWPNRRDTTKMTTAVIIFAVVFGGMIAIVDYGIEKLFRNLILN